MLADNRQLNQMVQFCTNPVEFSVFSVDPMFNIFKEALSLTVTTYRNLKLISKETGKAPVFLGPMLIHQKKDCKAYSKLCHSMITENLAFGGLLAIGTDGEKALSDGFRRNFRFAVFLRCFIHFKKGIEGNLRDRTITCLEKKASSEILWDVKMEKLGMKD